MSVEEVNREDALYWCDNCRLKRVKWHQMMIYRGVRDCCPTCYHRGVVHTMRRMMKVGDKVQLTTSIFDDGEDHHPPGWLAFSGEVLVVRKVHESGALAVSHEAITDSSFAIYPGEYVATTEPSDNRAHNMRGEG